MTPIYVEHLLHTISAGWAGSPAAMGVGVRRPQTAKKLGQIYIDSTIRIELHTLGVGQQQWLLGTLIIEGIAQGGERLTQTCACGLLGLVRPQKGCQLGAGMGM